MEGFHSHTPPQPATLPQPPSCSTYTNVHILNNKYWELQTSTVLLLQPIQPTEATEFVVCHPALAPIPPPPTKVNKRYYCTNFKNSICTAPTLPHTRLQILKTVTTDANILPHNATCGAVVFFFWSLSFYSNSPNSTTDTENKNCQLLMCCRKAAIFTFSSCKVTQHVTSCRETFLFYKWPQKQQDPVRPRKKVTFILQSNWQGFQ